MEPCLRQVPLRKKRSTQKVETRGKGKKITKREGKKQEKRKKEAGRRIEESRRRNWLGLCWSEYPHSHRPCLAPMDINSDSY